MGPQRDQFAEQPHSKRRKECLCSVPYIDRTCVCSSVQTGVRARINFPPETELAEWRLTCAQKLKVS